MIFVINRLQAVKAFKLKSCGVWIPNNSGIWSKLMHTTVQSLKFQMLFMGFFHFRPVHGLIFLFKYVQDDEPTGSVVRDDRLESIFFAKQVIHFLFVFATV